MSELGNLLKKVREDQGKTLASVKNDTRIQEAFLIAIEAGDYKSLPSYLHAYGFVKKYAESLGLDYDKDIKGIFDKECPKNPRLVFEEEHEDPIRQLVVASSSKEENTESKNTVSESNIYPENAVKEDDSRNLSSGKEPPKKALKDSVESPYGDGSKNFPVVKFIAAAAILIVAVILFINSSKDEEVVEVSVTDETPGIVPFPADNYPSAFLAGDNESAGEYYDNFSGAADDNASVGDNLTFADNLTSDEGVLTEDNYSAPSDMETSFDNFPKTARVPAGGHTVVLSFSEECWVSYSADNKTAREYLSPAGTSISLKFDNFFTLDVGNAAALVIKYDGKVFSGFGRPGMVRKLKYAADNGTLVRLND